MKTLVTGGAGFIGSHLVEKLLREKHSVVVLDNFCTGRKQNLAHLDKNQNLEVHKCDISQDLSMINRYFQDADWIFHLAARADIVPSIVNPLEYFQSNVTGTINILEASRKNNIKKFIYAASSSCYGIPDVYPTPETAPIRPQYPYALTKNLGEQMVLHWGLVYKLPIVSLRFFNVYGPRSRTSGTYGAVFGTFLAQKLADKPFTVVGNGQQTRDFTFVSDVVDAMLLAAKSPIADEVFNVGTGQPQSVNKLVKLIGGKAIHIPKRPGEPDKTQADISKIKTVLGWQPKVTFEQGVKKLLDNIDYWKTAPIWTPKKINLATKEWFKYLK